MKEYSVLFVRDTPNLNISFMQNIKKIKEKWIIHSEWVHLDFFLQGIKSCGNLCCKMLGHKNIKTTQIYAKMTTEKVGRDMAIFAENIKETKRKFIVNFWVNFAQWKTEMDFKAVTVFFYCYLKKILQGSLLRPVKNNPGYSFHTFIILT